MPAVFVHGVPDTQQVWDAVISRLCRKDVMTLSLPGFGCPLPAGFSATKEAYVDWLLGQLAALQGPIDLVGEKSLGEAGHYLFGEELQGPADLVVG